MGEEGREEDWTIDIPESKNNQRDWTNVDNAILGLILVRLGPVDHLRFGCVCRSWRSAARSPLMLLLLLLQVDNSDTEPDEQTVEAAGGRFYVVTEQGMVGCVDVDDDSSGPKLVWLDKLLFVGWRKEHAYIVNSDGELLVVLVACAEEEPLLLPTNPFRFLRLDPSTSKLLEVAAPRDRVLFLGTKSMSLEGRGRSRVYTVGTSAVGMFDLDTDEGSVCCCDRHHHHHHHGGSTAGRYY